MNADIKKLWVAALESGDYQQQVGSLRAGNRFCCLGVLCNLHAQAHPEIAAKQYYDNLYMHCTSLLPVPVFLWAGLNYASGNEVTIENKKLSLTYHNDSGRTFKEIAQAIREQL